MTTYTPPSEPGRTMPRDTAGQILGLRGCRSAADASRHGATRGLVARRPWRPSHDFLAGRRGPLDGPPRRLATKESPVRERQWLNGRVPGRSGLEGSGAR